MRIMVTGGAGFIGTHLVRWLLAAGHVVTVYDRALPMPSPPGWADPLADPNYRLVIGDLLAAERLDEALRGQELVVHLAANADVRFGTEHPRRDLEQNLIATHVLLDHLRQAGTPRLLFASTSLVYGEPRVFPTPEDAPFPIQTSLYGASKVAAEAVIGAYAHAFDVQATILRFAPVLGEGYAHGHVWDFVQKLRADPNHIEVLGNGKQRKSYVYVADAIDAVIRLIVRPPEAPVEVFNVSGPETCTVDRSLDWICGELGVWPTRTYTGGERGWPGDSPYILLDCTRLRALAWSCTVSLREAVERTVRSFA